MQSNETVERFKLQDWDDIEPREELKYQLAELKEDSKFYKEVWTMGMPFFTYRYKGEVLAIYGMTYHGAGTYVPSVILSKNIGVRVKTVFKLMQDYYAMYVARNARRLEASCDIMDEKAIRLAKHFGFSPIGIRHYASAEGHDQVIMERLVLVDPRKQRSIGWQATL